MGHNSKTCDQVPSAAVREIHKVFGIWETETLKRQNDLGETPVERGERLENKTEKREQQQKRHSREEASWPGGMHF